MEVWSVYKNCRCSAPMLKNEKIFLDSLFMGFSADFLPIKENFKKVFIAKNFEVLVENFKTKLNQACKKYNCSEEIILMCTYGILLVRFAGADEAVFVADGEKKFPVAINFFFRTKNF